jgi:hypothetical protein
LQKGYEAHQANIAQLVQWVRSQLGEWSINPTKNPDMVPLVIYLAVLVFLNISLSHQADEKVREIKRLESELKERKSAFIHLRIQKNEATKLSSLQVELSESGLSVDPTTTYILQAEP